MYAIRTLVELDDKSATADSTTRALTALALALRTVHEAVRAWNGAPEHGGCLCRVVDELEEARRIVAGVAGSVADVVVPLPARDPTAVSIANVACVLGRTTRVLTRLSRCETSDERHLPREALTDEDRRACAAACAIVFRALTRLRTAQESAPLSDTLRRHPPATAGTPAAGAQVAAGPGRVLLFPGTLA